MAVFGLYIGFASGLIESHLTEAARRTMTPAQFEAWQRERTEERRHQEMLKAIASAGERAGRGQ